MLISYFQENILNKVHLCENKFSSVRKLVLQKNSVISNYRIGNVTQFLLRWENRTTDVNIKEWDV